MPQPPNWSPGFLTLTTISILQPSYSQRILQNTVSLYFFKHRCFPLLLGEIQNLTWPTGADAYLPLQLCHCKPLIPCGTEFPLAFQMNCYHSYLRTFALTVSSLPALSLPFILFTCLNSAIFRSQIVSFMGKPFLIPSGQFPVTYPQGNPSFSFRVFFCL